MGMVDACNSGSGSGVVQASVQLEPAFTLIRACLSGGRPSKQRTEQGRRAPRDPAESTGPRMPAQAASPLTLEKETGTGQPTPNQDRPGQAADAGVNATRVPAILVVAALLSLPHPNLAHRQPPTRISTFAGLLSAFLGETRSIFSHSILHIHNRQDGEIQKSPRRRRPEHGRSCPRHGTLARSFGDDGGKALRRPASRKLDAENVYANFV